MYHGFFKPTLPGKSTPKIVVGLGETGVKGYRLLVVKESSRNIPSLDQ